MTSAGRRLLASAAAMLLAVSMASAVESASAGETDPGVKDTTPFAVGVAIDQRETTGTAGVLVARNFDQVTAENHMKPDAWYDGQRSLRMHPQAAAILDFASAHDLHVYGHTLVWYQQTPAWFFQNASSGQALGTSDADRAVLRERMRTHIFGVARLLSERSGLFGAGNPVNAFDVVNEVISDGPESDGLRRSEWYRILGEEYIDLAFRYADEAFNGVYAAPGVHRPVKLFINDYNTEYASKRARYLALVDRLLARGVPVDGVGHQFHVGLTTPVDAMAQAIDAFASRPVTQAVTELDVPVGTPVTAERLEAQRTYYRDAFAVFHARASSLYSVSVWGLTDSRSWRAKDGAPLLFADDYSPKPAFYGVLEAAPAPTGVLNATTRCVAGRIVVVTTVENRGASAAAVTVTSPYGSRALRVAAGTKASVAVSTRAATVPVGEVTVSSTDLVFGTDRSGYAAVTC
ncbi:endo-1,4-beta-xylanase [Microbacterium dextranolyticum]|uniref:Beta-xylanase n=1 Tax=Microbacterium dextranolyticum TaxID=36806 RepID=A0A9W6HKY9_9MICO|nr:endo-1,4-beta-xylanase [Microbacterium dextranolyticum]MBM7461605.1 GH35 family endo-1,4-beta-xylanase [Microbacterium dextranolyticum]GLJ94752.1 hypothetical protein GCM10017591_08140 [Microbacterium dextranolyticum]